MTLLSWASLSRASRAKCSNPERVGAIAPGEHARNATSGPPTTALGFLRTKLSSSRESAQ
jgi:hypothetical protein